MSATTFDSISGPAQTLAYLRGQAAGKRYRQREYEAAIAFFHDQGQSLDWIFHAGDLRARLRSRRGARRGPTRLYS
jgi:hypothetical protein